MLSKIFTFECFFTSGWRHPSTSLAFLQLKEIIYHQLSFQCASLQKIVRLCSFNLIRVEFVIFFKKSLSQEVTHYKRKYQSEWNHVEKAVVS